jgi:hypothetical protein
MLAEGLANRAQLILTPPGRGPAGAGYDVPSTGGVPSCRGSNPEERPEMARVLVLSLTFPPDNVSTAQLVG